MQLVKTWARKILGYILKAPVALDVIKLWSVNKQEEREELSCRRYEKKL